MKHRVIGILGFARAGKDTVSEILAEARGYQRMAFADPLKRIVMESFGFTEIQMWGSEKETPDPRYPREHVWNCSDSAATHDREPYCMCCRAIKNDPDREPCFLTPRYALQIIGTEGYRHCYEQFWAEKTLKDAEKIYQYSGYGYLRTHGVHPQWEAERRSVVITDVRFITETNAILRNGGEVYRIKRKGIEKPPYDHPSETEQLKIPDGMLNGVIMNYGTLEDLKDQVLKIVGE